MISSLSCSVQAVLGTLMTWGLTAAGSSVVFFVPDSQDIVLDASLGFAAGVMIAASFWSLLAPAIEMAHDSGLYGHEGQFSFIPVAIGFCLGAGFVCGADILVTRLRVYPFSNALETYYTSKKDEDYGAKLEKSYIFDSGDRRTDASGSYTILDIRGALKQRNVEKSTRSESTPLESDDHKNQHWKRILLMIIAITVHNIPEGLAVGVGFGAVGKSPSATFSKAKNLAIGIGIQNFPEGMAVSVPLRGCGFSVWKAFWWGQLSGMVEPLAGFIGAVAVEMCEPLLPYALSFAAGAMIFVVVDDIIPESHTRKNGRMSSFWCIFGFIIMMILDVGLG